MPVREDAGRAARLAASQSGPTTTGHATLAVLLLVALLIPFADLGSHSLWSPDEPTGAAVGANMVRSGDYILTRLGGKPFLEKPPLFWWVQAAGYRLFGVHDWVARLPAALFADATLLVAYLLGRRLGGPRTAWLTALVLATTFGFVEDTSRVVVDSALVLFVAAAHLGFVALVQAEAVAARWRASLLIAAATTLAFLAKGVVGPLLAFAIPAVLLVAVERRAAWRRVVPAGLALVPVFAAVVGPWVAALWRRGGGAAVRECLVYNTLGRAFGTEGGMGGYGHRQGPEFYFLLAPLVLLPWSLALPAVLARRREPSAWTSPAHRLLLGTAAVGLVALSAATTKRDLYLLPLMPAFAALVASWLAAAEPAAPAAGDRRTLRVVGVAATVVLALLAALYPVLLWAPIHSPLLDVVRAAIPVPAGAFFALAAGACALAAGTIARRSWAAPHRPRAVAWLLACWLVPWIAWQTALEAAVDPIKNLHPMTAAVARWMPGEGPVPFYARPGEHGERATAILDFDLGRNVERLETAAAASAYFADHPDGHLLVDVESERELDPGLRGRLVRLYDETDRTSAQYLIVALASAAPALSAAPER